MLLLSAALSLTSIPTLVEPRATDDWWWVAGDSRDAAAVFVDGGSVRRSGDTASVLAVRIARDGSASDMSWEGRCGERHGDKEVAAVARFACGSDDDHMEEAALLGGLSPVEAARAIFASRAREPARRRISD